METFEGHTPGPWMLDGDSGDGKRQFVKDCGNDTWNRCAVEIDSDDCDSTMAKANARLIAAAPTLLAQRNALVQMLKKFILLDDLNCAGGSLEDKARALLASLETPSA